VRAAAVQIGDVACVVGEHGHFRFARKPREARELPPAHDLVGHEHVRHTAVDQRLGLAHFLAAHAHGSGGDLPARNLGALVAFRVRTQAHAAFLYRLGHAQEIALERVHIENERGRCRLRRGRSRSRREGTAAWRRHSSAPIAVAEAITGPLNAFV